MKSIGMPQKYEIAASFLSVYRYCFKIISGKKERLSGQQRINFLNKQMPVNVMFIY
jgi:hypothetical protein